MSVPEYKIGLMFVTASAVAWSTAGFFTRLLPLDSWTMLAWRGIFGALGIAVVILALNRRDAQYKVWTIGWPGWLFAVVSAIGMVFFITSLRHTTVAHVAVIYASVPFVAAALGWLILWERPSRNALVASLAALIGVGIMVGVGTEGSPVGDLLALGMTLSMASMMIISRRYRDIPTMPAAALSALLSGIVCWPMGRPLAVSGHELLILALFGLVNSAVGLALFTVGARYLPAIETALIGSLDAPLAPLWVWHNCVTLRGHGLNKPCCTKSKSRLSTSALGFRNQPKEACDDDAQPRGVMHKSAYSNRRRSDSAHRGCQLQSSIDFAFLGSPSNENHIQ